MRATHGLEEDADEPVEGGAHAMATDDKDDA
jgi:hypothetical protein